MALSNLGDIITETLVRNGRNTSTAGITDAIIGRWLQSAHTRAAAYKKWPFTEGRVSTTFAATEEWSFEGYKSDSFRIVTIGGKRLQKLDYTNYQIYREEEPSGNGRYFSDIGRIMVINPYIDLSGTLTAVGQYQPVALDVTDLTASTIFTGFDEEGNEALVQIMTSYIKNRDNEAKDAEVYEKKAMDTLDRIWQRVLDEQFKYQTHPDSGGMFGRIDVINGGMAEEIFKRDQF